MGGILRRREMMIHGGTPPTPPSGDAYISATSNVSLETPCALPTGSTLILEGVFDVPNAAKGLTFFDFSANKKDFRKHPSYNDYLIFRYYGNDFEIHATGITQNVKKVELSTSSRYFLATLADDTVVASGTAPRAWANTTTALRIYLSNYLKITKITQLDSSSNVVHELTPTTQNNQVGLLDSVTNTFYGTDDSAAYIGYF